MLNTWALRPFNETQFDPDCPHCRIPGYMHSHWVPPEDPPPRPGLGARMRAWTGVAAAAYGRTRAPAPRHR